MFCVGEMLSRTARRGAFSLACPYCPSAGGQRYAGPQLDIHVFQHQLEAMSREEFTRLGVAHGEAAMARFPYDAEAVVVVDLANIGLGVALHKTLHSSEVEASLAPAYEQRRVCTVLVHELNLSFTNPLFEVFHDLASASRASALNSEQHRRAKTPPLFNDTALGGSLPMWGDGTAVTNLAALHYPRIKNLGDFAVVKVIGELRHRMNPRAPFVVFSNDRLLLSTCAAIFATGRVKNLMLQNNLDLFALIP
jgi:hypothetical protein